MHKEQDAGPRIADDKQRLFENTGEVEEPLTPIWSAKCFFYYCDCFIIMLGNHNQCLELQRMGTRME